MVSMGGMGGLSGREKWGQIWAITFAWWWTRSMVSMGGMGGLSGRENGARYGPSLMSSGAPEAW